MATSLIVLALFVAATVATDVPATKYPAGVHPHLCPNYPYCDNVALAADSVLHHGAVAPYSASSYATFGHNGAVVHGAGAKYPAGVNPHTCPNYPYCDKLALTPHSRGHHGAIAPYAASSYATYGHQDAVVHGDGAKHPAGVSPHTCPNYPYCGPTPVHFTHKFSGSNGWIPHVGLVGHGLDGAYATPIWKHGVLNAHNGAGAQYPAGVNPHFCLNYPYCHH